MALNIKELIALADRLDEVGKHDEANQIDKMVQKLAITMVEQDDEEFKKKLQEEGWSSPQVYVGKPDEEVTEQDKIMPDPQKIAPQEGEGLSESLKMQLASLIDKGWNIFAPGELEAWMTSRQEEPLSPEEIQEALKGLKSAKRIHRMLKTADEEMSLPPHLPGAFDLESPHRIMPVEIKQDIMQKIQELFENPDEETGHDLISIIEEFIKTQPKQPMSDEQAVEQVKEYEQQIGVPQGGWPDNPQHMLQATFQKLTELADRLDKVGASAEADLVDGFIRKYSTDLEYQGEGDTEQSKRYDAKYHHALQVREPKTKQERVDREGREKHHVHTQQQVAAGGLSTRYCPQHVGVSMGRVGESTYQCPLCREIYNWETGWTDHDGNEHPGGSVAAQTPDSSGYAIPHRIFDSRENISNRVN